MTLHAVPMSNTPAEPPAAEREFAHLMAASLRVAWSDGRVVEVPAGYTTGWRRMPRAVVALVVAGHSTIEHDDQRPRRLGPGMAICVPSGVLHRITHHDDGVSAFAHIDFRVFATVDVLALVEAPLIIQGEAAEEIGRLAAALASVDEGAAGLIGRVCTRQALAFALLDVLVRSSGRSPRALEAMRAAQRLAPALDAIDRDLGQVDIAALARAAKLSPSRLHTVFQQAFACAPMAWARRRRLERARELLAGTGLPVAEVAERSGFSDQFHFSRAFKATHGVSPSAYRERLGEARF